MPMTAFEKTAPLVSLKMRYIFSLYAQAASVPRADLLSHTFVPISTKFQAVDIFLSGQKYAPQTAT